MTLRTVSQQIADWLVEHGVLDSFSVTGGGSMFLNQAFGSHLSIRSVYMHHEQACAMAAEGYARTCGRPAVVVVTTGPGAINALNGVFGAYTDSIPMLILSGQARRETCKSFYELPALRQLGDQEGPTLELAKPICKFAKLVTSVGELASVLPTAFAQMTTGRPGPVWLDIPLDIQSSLEQIDFEPLPYKNPQAEHAAIERHCSEVLDQLRNSSRPILLLGTGIRISNQIDRILEFAALYSIPICTAWTHDLIESNHHLFAGRPGTIGSRAGNFCLQAADYVLVLGSRLNIRQTSYNFSSFARNAQVVQVDIDPAELNKPTYKPDTHICADLADFVPQLLDKAKNRDSLSGGDKRFDSWLRRCQTINLRFSPYSEHVQSEHALLNPYVAVERIFDRMPEQTISVCGNASACIVPFQVGRIKKGTRLFSNSGSASMGYDLPAAIGAAVASGGQAKVVCLAGDGSIQMNIQELQTLKTLNANVLVIVINNGGYLSIRQTHHNFFGIAIGATPATGIEFPDFCKVATAYGIVAKTVDRLSDLDDMLNQSWKSSAPMLINMIVDPSQEFSPRIKSRVDEAGRFVTPELDDMYPFLPHTLLDWVRKYLQGLRSDVPEMFTA